MSTHDAPALLAGWKEFLVFPSQSPALAYLLALTGGIAAVDLLSLYMPGPLRLAWGLIAVGVTILLWIALYRYASEILVSASRGRPEPPEMISMDAADTLALRHIVLWLLATLAVAVITLTGGGGFWLVAACVVMAAVLPAATVVLTLTGSLLEAVNPLRWWALVQGTGHDYEVAAGWLVLLALGYLLVERLVEPLGWLVNAAMIFAWGWGLFGWFHLLGRLVALHAEELGMERAPVEDQRDEVEVTDESGSDADPHAVHERLRRHGGSEDEHEWLHRRLRAEGAREAMLAHARDYIPTLVYSHDKPGRALDLAGECLRDEPGFCLAEAAHMRDLVVAGAELERAREVMQLVAAFEQGFPGHRLQPEVELTGCRMLAQQPGEARHVGRWLRRLAGMDLNADQKAEVRDLMEALRSRGANGS